MGGGKGREERVKERFLIPRAYKCVLEEECASWAKFLCVSCSRSCFFFFSNRSRESRKFSSQAQDDQNENLVRDRPNTF